MTTYDQATSILEESTKIKTTLLKLQKQIGAITRQAENELIKTIHQELGHDEASNGYGNELVDTRVSGKITVLSPKLLATVLPVSKHSAQTTDQARHAITKILNHEDTRLLVVVGPCSIHDPNAALEYAKNVKTWREQHATDLEIVMRTYLEKPRTELGWKGFVYDPLLDESDDINLGLIASRMLACCITDMGVPIAVERLNALTPQYINSLVAYDVIGARNTTDQKAREYASATSSPVGFKNTPEGSIEFAAQAIVSASGKHAFLGIDSYGATKQVNSLGNKTGHIILRGAGDGPNYDSGHVQKTKQLLEKKGLLQSIVIDVSHGNSAKKAENQIIAIRDICRQLTDGEVAICGVMIESNLVGGSQKITKPENLVYGQSVTDECVGLAATEEMLVLLAEASQKRQKQV